jgi:hypothetical protein
MTAPAQPLPSSLEDITAKWLTETLRAAGALDSNAEVTSVAHDLISAGVGFIGVVARLSLEYSPGASGPASIVAKLASPDPGSRMLGAAFGLYEREASFYSDLAATCGIPAPSAYFARYDAALGNVVILLEDLTDGAFGDQIAGCTLEQAELAIDALARFHAAWWRNPRLDSYAWLKSGIEIIRQPVALMYQASYPVAIERYGHLLTPEIIAMAPTLLPRAMKGIDLLMQLPETLTQGDYRLDNLFYGSSPERPLVVCDWQGPARGPAITDLAYFVAGSLPTDTRRAHEDDLLRRYHARLQERGVRDLPYDQLYQTYRQYFAGIPVAAGMVLLANIPEGNERGRTMIETITARFLAASDDLDAMSLLPEA